MKSTIFQFHDKSLEWSLIMPIWLGNFRAISIEPHSRDFHTQKCSHCALLEISQPPSQVARVQQLLFWGCIVCRSVGGKHICVLSQLFSSVHNPTGLAIGKRVGCVASAFKESLHLVTPKDNNLFTTRPSAILNPCNAMQCNAMQCNADRSCLKMKKAVTWWGQVKSPLKGKMFGTLAAAPEQRPERGHLPACSCMQPSQSRWAAAPAWGRLEQGQLQCSSWLGDKKEEILCARDAEPQCSSRLN